MFYRNEELADMSVLVVFGEPYASPEDKDISNSEQVVKEKIKDLILAQPYGVFSVANMVEIQFSNPTYEIIMQAVTSLRQIFQDVRIGLFYKNSMMEDLVELNIKKLTNHKVRKIYRFKG